METTETIILVASILAVVGVFWMAWRRRTTFDAESINATLADVLVAIDVARELVLGAEQLWETGQLPENERFRKVWDTMDELFPDLDGDIMELIIEAAVHGMKMIAPTVETIITDRIQLEDEP